ncbi:hypothetical protein M427DRAFT_62903 [Gonapodya prolifera JEL478]|uniref:MYND-type domain-containing protein n=1 Tax=Gonapodya prolifera (strain JEL478) TaxID=1344416 RepID=A0A139A083_GONPJ|nr:hypothetical protein M427DRAFT_62903 [Gonapodya prolifera JEL478]|eukprot:KXS10169.1 hypothetical protein M427DRAFT_62903 [Gonapodya prolifera JEL478]
MRCSRCHGAYYCGKDCQVKDYKRGHKEICNDLAMMLRILEFPELQELHDLYLQLRRDELKRRLVAAVELNKFDGQALTLLTQVVASKHRADRCQETGDVPESLASPFLSPCAKDHPETLARLSHEDLDTLYTLPCPIPPTADLPPSQKPLRELLEETSCGHSKEDHPPARFFYSFCTAAPVRVMHHPTLPGTTHCPTCRACMDAAFTHCAQCDSCAYGVVFPCTNCHDLMVHADGVWFHPRFREKIEAKDVCVIQGCRCFNGQEPWEYQSEWHIEELKQKFEKKSAIKEIK